MPVYLREKIGDDAQNSRFIKNIWRVGYTIEGWGRRGSFLNIAISNYNRVHLAKR